jgi:sirohydrochlorin cobaltochelatase
MRSFRLCALVLALCVGLVPAGWAATEKTAVLLTAFGTSTKARVVYDQLESDVKTAFPGVEVRWAYTSEGVRRIVNQRAEKAGSPERLLSPEEALTKLSQEGFERVALSPLLIFTGEEYEEAHSAAEAFPTLRIATGPALVARWDDLVEVVAAIAPDFLKPEEGCNLLVAHGSPSLSAPSNVAMLALERHLAERYPNVALGAVDGFMNRDQALAKAQGCAKKRVRIVPFMLVAGDHVQNDLMGEGAHSWKKALEAQGFAVDAPARTQGGERVYTALGDVAAVRQRFVRNVRRLLEGLEKR